MFIKWLHDEALMGSIDLNFQVRANSEDLTAELVGGGRAPLSSDQGPLVVLGYMGVSKNKGNTPQIIHFNRVFHYFHHPFWGKTPLFLGYFWVDTHIGDEILPSYIGIIINHYKDWKLKLKNWKPHPLLERGTLRVLQSLSLTVSWQKLTSLYFYVRSFICIPWKSKDHQFSSLST